MTTNRLRSGQFEFVPVIMIPEAIRTPADNRAIEHLHTLHQIVMNTMDTERSRKTEIGISEIGGECRKCVARKLSGLYPNRSEGGAGWRAQVGTMGHDYLERDFRRQFPWMFEQYEVETPDGKLEWRWRTIPELNPTPEHPELYYLERKLDVWSYKGLELNGSCDLFTRIWTPEGELGVVSDWKFQGPTKLKKTAQGKIGGQYFTQMSTYGLGYELQELIPTHLDLHALPRDGNLDESKPVLMRYDRQVAVDAIAQLAALIDAAEIIGWEEVIRAQPVASPCFDCGWYEDVEQDMLIRSITA